MCSIEAENWLTIRYSFSACTETDEQSLEFVFRSDFEYRCATRIRTFEVFAILRKSFVCRFMSSVDFEESLFFGSVCFRICDLDTVFSFHIVCDGFWTVAWFVSDFIADNASNIRLCSLTMA